MLFIQVFQSDVHFSCNNNAMRRRGKQSTTQSSTPSCNPPGEYHSCTAFVSHRFLGLMCQPGNSNCAGYNAQFDNQVVTWHTTAIVKNPLAHIACCPWNISFHPITKKTHTHPLLVSRAIIRRRSQPTRIGYLGCCCKVHNSPGNKMPPMFVAVGRKLHETTKQ